MQFNTIWISSVPRTGSMWLYNVTREIFKLSKFNVLPKEIPQTNKDNLILYQNFSINDNNDKNRYVLKIHKPIPIILKKSKILTTIRDPRDICISYKEFMKVDFNSALKATRPLKHFIKNYNKFSDEYLKIIKYEDIENRAVETLAKISKFINVNLDSPKAEKISNKFNKLNIKKLIKKNDKRILNKIENKKKILKKEIVYFSNKNFRSYDSNTGFQSGHISNRNSGDWKNKFSDNEIKIMNKEFKEILEEYNYEI